MIHSSALPLHDDRFTLRRLTAEDAAAFAHGASDPQVQAFAHLPRTDYTAATVREMIDEQVTPSLARGDLAVLAVADRETDELIGSLVLFDVTVDSAEVGFWVSPAHRGTGAASAALHLGMRLARLSGLHRLSARTVPDNPSSQKVLIRTGFTETGRGREVLPSNREAEVIRWIREIAPCPQVPLATSRLLLRLHTGTDAEPLRAIYAQPDVAKYLLDDPWDTAAAQRHLSERINQTDLRADGALALVITHQGTVIGDVMLWSREAQHRLGEIGWVLDPAFGGAGLASEAVEAVLRLAFNHYHLHRVAAQMDARNTASARLAERVGLRREAHLRQDWWNKGEWTDTLIYAQLRPEADDQRSHGQHPEA